MPMPLKHETSPQVKITELKIFYGAYRSFFRFSFLEKREVRSGLQSCSAVFSADHNFNFPMIHDDVSFRATVREIPWSRGRKSGLKQQAKLGFVINATTRSAQHAGVECDNLEWKSRAYIPWLIYVYPAAYWPYCVHVHTKHQYSNLETIWINLLIRSLIVASKSRLAFVIQPTWFHLYVEWY